MHIPYASAAAGAAMKTIGIGLIGTGVHGQVSGARRPQRAGGAAAQATCRQAPARLDASIASTSVWIRTPVPKPHGSGACLAMASR